MNYGRASVGNSLKYLICLKSERVLIYSVLKSVKLLLALSIFVFYHLCQHEVQTAETYFGATKM